MNPGKGIPIDAVYVSEHGFICIEQEGDVLSLNPDSLPEFIATLVGFYPEALAVRAAVALEMMRRRKAARPRRARRA
jgi:hypothetical protein